MSRTENPTPTLSLDPQADETRMRRALGLTGGHGGHAAVHQQRPEQARQRHRFAQDGSVPVVMLNRHGEGEASGAKERIAALEAALDHERAAHGATKRALQELQAANQATQTRLAHATLAHTEALSSERQARKAVEEALAAALTAASTHAPAPQAMAPHEDAKPKRAAPVFRKPRANAAPPKEPKPVRWWTPSYRTKKKSG